MTIRRWAVCGGIAATMAIVAVSCSDDSGGSSTTTSATTSSTTSTTSAPAVPALSLGDPGADGSVPVSVGVAALDPLFFGFNQNGDDPFWQLHTQQDDLFLNVELFTVFGPGWPGPTGPTGTFATDCGANGICVYVDTDGVGPLPVNGPAEAGGQITIDRLEDGGYDITLAEGITFATVDPTLVLAGAVQLTG